MSDQPLISVVIIFWNAERFIAEAIESVLAQTYSHWELLLVDDGSSDASTILAQRYADKGLARIRYLEHPNHENRGMSASRNLGVRHAKGHYVAFLDADDVWFPNTLEDQATIIETHPNAALVYGPIQYWFGWTGKTEDQGRDYIEELGVPADTIIPSPSLLPLFLRNQAAVPSGFLARREWIERVGGFEDAFRGEYEDQVFCAKICLSAPVFAARQCWYRYRQHAESCVSVGMRTGKTRSARLFFLHWLESYLSKQKVKSPPVWRGLRYELFRYTHPKAFYWMKRGEQITNQLNERFKQRWAGIWHPS